MKKIAVVINGNLYAWVDTVVMTDETERPIAILVDPKDGSVFTRDIITIKVVDNDILI